MLFISKCYATSMLALKAHFCWTAQDPIESTPTNPLALRTFPPSESTFQLGRIAEGAVVAGRSVLYWFLPGRWPQATSANVGCRNSPLSPGYLQLVGPGLLHCTTRRPAFSGAEIWGGERSCSIHPTKDIPDSVKLTLGVL